MLDPGYATYQDPRLIPDQDDDLYTPQDFYESCTHQDACFMQWKRANPNADCSKLEFLGEPACVLGCSEDCPCYDN